MSRTLEVLIRSKDQPDAKRWEEQRTRILRSGARFERITRSWRLSLDLADAQGTAAALSELFLAARNYNTSVLVMDPVTGEPAMSVLSEPPILDG